MSYKALDIDNGGTTTGYDPVLTVPATALVGDFMVVVVQTSHGSNTGAPTPPATETWTLQESASMPIVDASTSDSSVWIYTKDVSQDDEDNAGTKTYTWTFGASEEQCGVLVLTDPATWGQFAKTEHGGTAGTTAVAPSVTTTVADELVFHCGLKDSGVAFTGFPSGDATVANEAYGATNGAGSALGIVREEYASTGATGTKTFNLTSEGRSQYTFSLEPVDLEGISSIDPTTFDMDNADIDINGLNFLATQGSGDVYLSDANTLAGSANEVDITSAVNTWSDTVINLDLTQLSGTELGNLHTLGPGTRYIIVVNNDSDEYGSLAITLHRPEAFVMSLGAGTPGATTARLTAPATKTTGDFDAGRFEEAANPATAVDITADDYTEIVWSIEAKTLARDVAYQFRVTKSGTVIDTYTVTPQMTISSAVTVQLNALTSTVTTPALTVSPGTATIPLNALVLTGTIPTTSVSVSIIVQLNALISTVTLPALTVVPGTSTVNLNSLALLGNVPSLSVIPGSISSLLDALQSIVTLPTITVDISAATPNIVVKESGGDYDNLEEAIENASAGNWIEIQGEWTASDEMASSATITVSVDNLTVTCDSDSHHIGYSDDTGSHYRLRRSAGNGHTFTVNADGFSIDGVDILHETTGLSDEIFRFAPGKDATITVSNCLCGFTTGAGEQDILYLDQQYNVTINFENDVFFNAQRAVIDLYNVGTTVIININSCTCLNINVDNSLYQTRSGLVGAQLTNPDGIAYINIFNTLYHANHGNVDSVVKGGATGSFSVAVDQSFANESTWVDGNENASTIDSSCELDMNFTDNKGLSEDNDYIFLKEFQAAPATPVAILHPHRNNKAQDTFTRSTMAGEYGGQSLSMPSADTMEKARPYNTSYDVGAFEIRPHFVVKESGGDYDNLRDAVINAIAYAWIEIQGTWSADDAPTSLISIANDNVRISCDEDSAHPGYPHAGTGSWYRLRPSSAVDYGFTISGDNVEIDGIDLQLSTTAASSLIYPNVSLTTVVKNCLLGWDNTGGTKYAIYESSSGGSNDWKITLENCFVYNAVYALAAAAQGNLIGSETAIININSCTFLNLGLATAAAFYVTTGGSATAPTVSINIFNSLFELGTATWELTGSDGDAALTMNVSVDHSMTNVDDWTDASVDNETIDASCQLDMNFTEDNTKSSDGDWIIVEDNTSTVPDCRLQQNTYNEALNSHTDSAMDNEYSGESITMPAADFIGFARPYNTNYDLGPHELETGVIVQLDALTSTVITPNTVLSLGEYTAQLNALDLASNIPNIGVSVATIIVLNALNSIVNVPNTNLLPGEYTAQLNALDLASNIPVTSIIPGEYTAQLNALDLASNIPNLNVTLATFVYLNALNSIVNAPNTNLLPGEYTAQLNALDLVSNIPTINLLPGEYTAQLNALDLVSTPAALSVVPGVISVALNALISNITLPTTSIVPGTASILLDALNLTSNTVNLSVSNVTGVLVFLDAINLASNIPNLTQISGPVTVPLDALNSNIVIPTIIVSTATLVALNALNLISNIPNSSIIPGTAVINLNALDSNIIVPNTSIIPGTVSIPLNVLNLVGTPVSLSVQIGGTIIPLNALQVITQIPASSLIAGPVTIPLNALDGVITAANILAAAGDAPAAEIFMGLFDGQIFIKIGV